VINFVRDFYLERDERTASREPPGIRGEIGRECPGAVGVEREAPQ
jgi:hypothetical protein